jgi:hypothetical protein
LTRARSPAKKRTLDAVKTRCPPLDAQRNQKGTNVFVELDTRHDARYTVSLEWDRITGETQIVVGDSGTSSLLVFPVVGAKAGDAFRHPFRYAP